MINVMGVGISMEQSRSFPPQFAAPGVYTIEHVPSGRKYVGASKCMASRWREHVSMLRGQIHSEDMNRDFAQDGPGAFRFTVLEFIESADPDELQAVESLWMCRLKPEYNRKQRPATLTHAYRLYRRLVKGGVYKPSREVRGIARSISSWMYRPEAVGIERVEFFLSAIRAAKSSEGV